MSNARSDKTNDKSRLLNLGNEKCYALSAKFTKRKPVSPYDIHNEHTTFEPKNDSSEARVEKNTPFHQLTVKRMKRTTSKT